MYKCKYLQTTDIALRDGKMTRDGWIQWKEIYVPCNWSAATVHLILSA